MDLLQVQTSLVPASSLFFSGQAADLISLADLKLELNVTTTADDGYMAKLITRASTTAANYCKRTFQPALWMENIYPKRDAYPWQVPPRLEKLQLSNWPQLGGPSLAGTAPPQAPQLGTVGGGSLSATRYYARLTYVTPSGESAASLETNLALSASALLTVGAPGADKYETATGYNVYIGTSSFNETLQNETPIGLDTAWTLPASGLVAGSAAPYFATIVENTALSPNPLAEGVDFLIDAENGQATRLWAQTGEPKSWGFPVTIVYRAGYAAIPDDLQEAIVLLAKARYFARQRDPMIRNENIPGVYEAAYWLGTGIGGQGDLPVDVCEKLDRYRTPTLA